VNHCTSGRYSCISRCTTSQASFWSLNRPKPCSIADAIFIQSSPKNRFKFQLCSVSSQICFPARFTTGTGHLSTEQLYLSMHNTGGYNFYVGTFPRRCTDATQSSIKVGSRNRFFFSSVSLCRRPNSGELLPSSPCDVSTQVGPFRPTAHPSCSTCQVSRCSSIQLIAIIDKSRDQQLFSFSLHLSQIQLYHGLHFRFCASRISSKSNHYHTGTTSVPSVDRHEFDSPWALKASPFCLFTRWRLRGMRTHQSSSVASSQLCVNSFRSNSNSSFQRIANIWFFKSFKNALL
jgi:hypothetical protein